MKTTRTAAIGTALAALAIAVSACGPANPGAAAVIGADRISDQQLTEAVQSVLRAQGRPVDSESAKLTHKVLQRMVTMSLVDQLATRAGVVITQGEIDRTYADYQAQAGGEKQFDGVLLSQDIAPADAKDAVRLNLLASKLAETISPGAEGQLATQQLIETLAKYSTIVGLSISPRYGTWDPGTLTVGPLPSDLSIPTVG